MNKVFFICIFLVFVSSVFSKENLRAVIVKEEQQIGIKLYSKNSEVEKL
jgi:hypothetical protein